MSKDRAVLYEAIAQAEQEATGFDVHPSQINTEEGDHGTVPQWRLDQIAAMQEEKAEDLIELSVSNPAEYKRQIKKNKKKLAVKEEIYALVKRAETGDDDALDDYLGDGGGEAEAAELGDEDGGEVEMPDAAAYAAAKATLKRGNRKGSERFVPGTDGVQKQMDELDLDAAFGEPHKSIEHLARAVGSSGGGGGGKSSDVPLNLQGKRWYAGEIDRSRCEGVVKACMQGDYLVRKSTSSSGYVLCVNDKGQAINYTISVKGPTAFVFTQASFNSLEDVITYAQGTPLKSVAVPGSRLILNHPAINEPYLCVEIDRPTSERHVGAAKHGDFTIRLSSSGDKYVLVVNDQGTPCSYSITTSPDKRFVFGGQMHDSVQAVVLAMKKTAFKSQKTYEMMLGNPAPL